MSSHDAHDRRPAYIRAAEELRDNPGQWQAYESRGNCVVLAGPGSGKTKVLTIKLARMLAEDVKPPRGIACITYSSECARELERRLGGLGIQPSPRLFVGTVHAFCFAHLVLPYATLGGLKLPDKVRVASPEKQDVIFEEAWIQVFGRRPRPNRTEMDQFRRTWLDRGGERWLDRNEPMPILITVYETKLRSAGYIDFDDMTLLGLQLVQDNPWVRKLLSARYPVVVIDEYQDLGLPLHLLATQLCFNAGVRILAVGDPDQSIYGFTGAQPHLLRELATEPEIEQVQLRMNYRSARKIVRAAEILLGEEEGRFGIPDRARQGTVEFHEYCEGLEEQASAICSELIPAALARAEKRTLGDIAVLYVDKNDGDLVARVAANAGIDRIIRIDRNAPYQKTPLTRWLEDCGAWCSGGWEKGQPLLSRLIADWGRLNRNAQYSDKKMLLLRQELVRFLWRNRDPYMPLSSWIECFRISFLQLLDSAQWCALDERSALVQLITATKPGHPLASFTVGMFAGQGGAPDHLNLITLHSAKGREFQVVFMIGMEQGRIPSWNDTLQTQIAERRRLFYVGLTRAKHEVHILYSGWYFDSRQRVHADGPSVFLAELRNRLG